MDLFLIGHSLVGLFVRTFQIIIIVMTGPVSTVCRASNLEAGLIPGQLTTGSCHFPAWHSALRGSGMTGWPVPA